MTSISYAITACTEYEELNKLLETVTHYCTEEDEIVVLLDEDNVTDLVKEVCNKYIDKQNLFLYYRPLNRDFASHKNYLNSKCTKHWIFNLDADEYPTDDLIANVKELLKLNDSVDLIAVPRINIVKGLTQDHVIRWNWQIDEKGRVNWPDYQLRLYKNVPYIKWEGKVHERPTGWKVGSHLPFDVDNLALVHIKDIKKQEQQNTLYNSL